MCWHPRLQVMLDETEQCHSLVPEVDELVMEHTLLVRRHGDASRHEGGYPRMGKRPATLDSVVVEPKILEAESDEGALQQAPFPMVGHGL